MMQQPTTLIPATAVRERLGISEMTLWRWLRDPEIRFPRPFYIKKRRYWRASEVTGWIEARNPGRASEGGGRKQDGSACASPDKAYVSIPHNLIDSDLWHKMRPMEVKLLLTILRVRANTGGRVVAISASKAAAMMGSGSGNVDVAFRVLRYKGLIDKEDDVSHGTQPTRWVLSNLVLGGETDA